MMAYVNAFLRAWNDNREVSVGGRRSSDSVGAWLNTANQNGEAGMTVTARVEGENVSSRDRRKHGDDRVSVFTVELPERGPAVMVRIVEHGHKLKKLAAIGAALCLVKGAAEIGSNPDHARKCVRFGIETLVELEAEIGKNVPDVELPGGYRLAHALACIEIVQGLADGKDN